MSSQLFKTASPFWTYVKKKRQPLFFFILALLLTAFFYAGNLFLFHRGMIADQLLFLGEKSELLWHGAEPRLANTLFIAPILPYTLVFLLRSPLLASAVVGGFCLASLIFLLVRLEARAQMTRTTAVLFTLYLLFSPSLFLLFSQAFVELTFFCLFLLALYALRRYLFEKTSVSLFVFGLSLGLLIQNTLDYAYAAVFIPVLFAITYLHKRPFFPIAAAAYFPVIWFVLAPYVLNKLYLGHFNLDGIQHLFLTNEDREEAGWFGKISHFIDALFFYFPLMLPYWFFWLRISKMSVPVLYTAFLATPLLFLFVKTADPESDKTLDFMLPVLFSLLCFAKSYGSSVETRRWKSLLFACCLGISFIFSAVDLFYSGDPQERLFARTLFLQEKRAEQPASFDQLATILKRSEGFILADDRSLYKLVYVVNAPGRFILPYQYHFKTILYSPADFVSFIVIGKDPMQDVVLQTYPDGVLGKIPGFAFRGEFGNLLLFERK